MAELTIISETGMFHSVCRFSFSQNRVNWRGFQPARHRTPVSPGAVEHVDRTRYINHFIRFSVEENLLRQAMEIVTNRYSSRVYALGVVDCVSFSADVARQCRLRVPAINITPFGLIKVLTFWNDYDKFE